MTGARLSRLEKVVNEFNVGAACPECGCRGGDPWSGRRDRILHNGVPVPGSPAERCSICGTEAMTINIVRPCEANADGFMPHTLEKL